MTLPTDNDERKALPVWDFLMNYFPDAFLELVRVSVEGNKQHNPGEKLHWAREKSTDQLNTALRHQIDYGTGVRYDADGRHHLAKAAWRLLAQVQLDLEKAKGMVFKGDHDVGVWVKNDLTTLPSGHEGKCDPIASPCTPASSS